MAHVFSNRVQNDLQDHSRSLVLAPTKGTYGTSYWSSTATLVLSCHISEILELLYAESHFLHTYPYSSQNFSVFPLA